MNQYNEELQQIRITLEHLQLQKKIIEGKICDLQEELESRLNEQE